MNIFRSAATALLAITLTACSPQQWHQDNGVTWGTSYHIKYKSDRPLTDSIIAEMQRIESLFSFHDPKSEISRINQGASDSTAFYAVSTEMRQLILAAQKVSLMSGGAFDPTVGPLVDLWGFGRDKTPRDSLDRYFAPAQSRLDSALRLVGIADCRLTPKGLIKKHPGTRFDFSGIAKGYGVDCVARALERCGVTDYMVEIGGEIAVRGQNDRGDTWTISIDDPLAGSYTAPGVASIGRVSIAHGAVATSSNSRNRHTLTDGRIVGHSISPADGQPFASDILSATILSSDCTMADAIATACMCMPPDAACQMLRDNDIAALLVIARPDSPQSPQIWTSPTWPDNGVAFKSVHE